MRRVALLVVLAACGHAAAPASQPPGPPVPRLLPPRPVDPAARGAGYLTAVAMQLQPGWGQFLDDCRLRLPASHTLNQMTLAATAELVVARDGKVESVKVATSGNADFDRAVSGVIADAEPLAAPPAELLSDDDRAHLRWLFARDRRQAGPATAELIDVQLPLYEVVAKWAKSGELARAARRIVRTRSSSDRDDATRTLMVAVLREALGGTDDWARRTAIVAIGRAHLEALAPDVRAHLISTTEPQVRWAAIEAAADLGDENAVEPISRALVTDLVDYPRLALGEAGVLAALHHSDVVADTCLAVLDDPKANAVARATALGALKYAPFTATKLAGRFGRGDALERAAACTAASGAELDVAWVWLGKGLRDADASVRAACVEAVHTQAIRHLDINKQAFDDRRIAPMLERIRELARDRDRAVRARSVAVLSFDREHGVRAIDDPAAEVRVAYAGYLRPRVEQESADLRALLDDRDADVRAAAWTRELSTASPDLAKFADHAMTDPAPQVRRAALPAFHLDELARLAASDDSPDVRTDALVLLAERRGRADVTSMLLERIADAPPGSPERVRAALAWLLAR
jgi:hypothetical protein